MSGVTRAGRDLRGSETLAAIAATVRQVSRCATILSMSSSVVTYSMPAGSQLPLELTPRLESWNAHNHPDQVRLREFVAHVRSLTDSVANQIGGPLSLHLNVGLDDGIDPLWERDLDNYLFPIARGLGRRYVSIWGTKGRAKSSFVTVGPAVPVAPPIWPAYPVPRAPGGEDRWKRAVRGAVAHAEQLPAGPVGVQIAMIVGPGRSWANSWKRTIDGLEPLLGRTYAHRDWNPQDGRVVRLGMHVQIDDSLGHDLEAVIWATPAEPSWPELAWFEAMNEDERREFMMAHRAVVDSRANSRGPKAAVSTPSDATLRSARQGSRRSGRPPTALPEGVVELTTEDDFELAVAYEALIVKTDSTGPPKLHFKAAECSSVSLENFRIKVIAGHGKNGRYYRTTDPAATQRCWPRLTLCGHCRQLDPAAATQLQAVLGNDGGPGPAC